MNEDRAAGVLLGLACGDALGRPIEFMWPAAIEREHGTVTEMLGYGTHGQPAGTITDDTEMALCIVGVSLNRIGLTPTTSLGDSSNGTTAARSTSAA